MKLFSYYALHTFKNQLKKLFKTWLLVLILVCGLIGAGVGLFAASVEDMAQGGEPPAQTETVEEPSLPERVGVEPLNLAELIAGAAILALFCFEIISADKNGSKIFQPADVNLLFPSPMQPQSVLMFRLTTQLGAALLASIYMFFQVPNLIVNFDMSLWGALALVAVWCFSIMLGKLLQVLLYLLCGTRPELKKYLRPFVYLLLTLLGVGFFVFWKGSGLDPAQAAARLFNADATRYIPLWGWLKGLLVFALEGNLTGCLLCLGAIAVGTAVLVYITRCIRADFYEDAMAKSEETAALLEQVQADQSGRVAMKKRKKDRSEKLRRDSMGHGAGANVFFFKTLYNRFRFAHFGFLTKTAETYLMAAAGVSLLCLYVFETDGMLPAVLTLAGLSFYRALGNPLAQDTKMGYFIMIPESTWAKLFWSLMGGAVNCLLDVLPAILIPTLLFGTNPLVAAAWMLFIVSMDFFATTVGTFIDLSLPKSLGKMPKQIAQILFIYFGLLPDAAILTLGIVLEHVAAAAVGAAALNVVLGLLFFTLAPIFIDPRDGKRFRRDLPFTGDLGAAKKHFSRLGLSIFVMLAVATVLQTALMTVLSTACPNWGETSWGMWLVTFAPIYAAAVPLGLLVLRRMPAAPPEKRAVKPGAYIITAIICIFMMYAGNFAGIAVTSLLGALLNTTAVNPIMTYAASDSVWLKILFMAILAPAIEEYVFRRQLIDRMRPYGEKLAMVTSAVMFGLFHGNLSQMFYAFALGLVFGYLYLKTGRLRYCVGLHMFINLLGGVVAPALVEKIDLNALENASGADIQALLSPALIGFAVYLIVMLGLALAGLVLLCVKSRDIRFSETELELPRGSRFKTVYLNAGMLLLILGSLALVALTVI